MSKKVKLQASDGHELDAYVAEPEGTPRAALVVVQEIFGVNEHIRAVADRFAKEGFYTVAPAIFDRVKRDVQLGYDAEGMQQGMGLAKQLEINQVLEDVEAALRYAEQETGKKPGVVGFCFGGTIAWLSAARLAPAAAVGYYGGTIAMFATETPKVPVILHFGKHDNHIPASDVAKVEAAHPEVPIYWYDAGHGFNCDMRGSFDQKAAKEAMARTLEFFNKHL
jgi:carboxymethylenebutenolidase